MPTSSKRTPRLSLAHLRATYRVAGLLETDLDPDPIVQFGKWFRQAQEVKLKEPNAMTLATATADGRPSARTVLLKEVDENGFVFYTNYESRKGRELIENPRAALVFYWEELERQVRVEGIAEKVSQEQSEEYFRTRPKGSRLGAWASRQGQVLPNREIIEDRLAELAKQYEASEDIPLPDYWGGFRVKPEIIEFWQGRPNRLHDRLCYRRESSGAWTISRLSP